MTFERDARWRRIFENVPSEPLIALAKKCPGHSLEKLYQDQEARVDEVLRVCDPETIAKIYEEFPGPFNYVAWLFTSDSSLTKSDFDRAMKKAVGDELLTGIRPKVEEKPKVYKVESFTSGAMFRCVASDREEHLPVSFLEDESIKVLSYYDAVLHFSRFEAVLFGPYSATRAEKVLQELDSFLGISSRWTLLKPGTGQSRNFYKALKKKLGGLLVETKRHDPTGDYRTITLEARDKHPDLEEVPDFKKYYIDADSDFDMLEFRCKNSLGFTESVRVKFGRPHGRFTFGPNPSQSAIRYFQSTVSELLRGT